MEGKGVREVEENMERDGEERGTVVGVHVRKEG